MEVFIMENIIFGITVIIAFGASMLTCIYEAGSTLHANASDQRNTEQDKKKNE